MKKYLSLLLVTVLLSCEQEQKEMPPAADARTAAPADTLPESPGITVSGCAAMPLFQQGTVIENVTRDVTGKEMARSTNTIISVTEKDGMKTADMEVVSSNDNTYHALYKCDGNVFYVDMCALMGGMKGMTNIKRQEVLMDFPLDMKEGDTLSTPSMTMTFNAGKINVTLTNTLAKRLVSGRQKVTTPAGTWDCFKVELLMNIHSEMQGGSMPTKNPMVMEKQMQMVIYFSVEGGMIRMELFEKKKLTSISELVAIRRPRAPAAKTQ